MKIDGTGLDFGKLNGLPTCEAQRRFGEGLNFIFK